MPIQDQTQTQTPPDRTLASALLCLREARDQSQEDLAHDADVTSKTLGDIERAQTDPRWTTVKKITEALGISFRELGEALDEHLGA